MMATSFQSNVEGIGLHSLVKIELEPESLDEMIRQKDRPYVIFMGDVSGSMIKYMDKLVNAALATVDCLRNGSAVSFITFDTDLSVVVEKVSP